MSNIFYRNRKPYVIAGPCSVEGRDQLRQCMERLSSMPEVSMIRCGVWKPRTRPGGFEGLGEPALQWIKELKQQLHGTKVCCEVARPEHVELCLRYGIEAVWIGARTASDPFSVDEIAQVIGGTGLAVMVKNPIAADVNLWQGAVERIMKVGTENIAAIHRGFYIFGDSSPYRNNPLWEVPIELRRRMPDLPILCDPSHMGGERRHLAKLMQTAADMGYDGYMIEVHPRPEEAITDSRQQIDFDELRRLLGNIVTRQKERPASEELSRLRKQIDEIDERLIQALGDRMKVSEKIAKLKAMENMEVFQPRRWFSLMQQRMTKADEAGLAPEFIKTIYEKIHAESLHVQEQTLKNITTNE